MKLFGFLTKKIYEGKVVDLKERYRISKKEAYDGIPTIFYDILDKEGKRIGSIDLRLENRGDMYYYGNVGYTIIKDYRGHGYAYEACLILFEIAKQEFNMKELIITCSPENIASYKTLVKLGGEYIETVDVPMNHTLYALGEVKKAIFKFKID